MVRLPRVSPSGRVDGSVDSVLSGLGKEKIRPSSEKPLSIYDGLGSGQIRREGGFSGKGKRARPKEKPCPH